MLSSPNTYSSPYFLYNILFTYFQHSLYAGNRTEKQLYTCCNKKRSEGTKHVDHRMVDIGYLFETSQPERVYKIMKRIVERHQGVQSIRNLIDWACYMLHRRASQCGIHRTGDKKWWSVNKNYMEKNDENLIEMSQSLRTWQSGQSGQSGRFSAYIPPYNSYPTSETAQVSIAFPWRMYS